MVRCVACGDEILIPDYSVPIPTGIERKRIFAQRLGIDESTFFNLPRRSFICQRHFNSGDFFRNELGQIIRLLPSAVPTQATPPFYIPPSQSVRPPPVRRTGVNFPDQPGPSTSSYRPSIPSHGLRLPPFLQKFINYTNKQKSPAPQKTPEVRPSGANFPDQNLEVQGAPPRVSQPLPSVHKRVPQIQPPPTSTTDITMDHDFDYEENVVAPPNPPVVPTKPKATPKPKRKKRGPYKKFVPRITNFDEIEFVPPTTKPLVAEEEKVYDELVDERVEMVLISKDRLLKMFTTCHVCGKSLGDIKKEFHLIGTAGTITYSCSKCPESRHTWATQDRIPGKTVLKGNALLSSAAHLTPISYPTLKLLFNLARISIFGNDRYKLSQQNAVWPVIGSVYNKENVNMLKMLKNRDGAVNLLMDAQYDSPGFCAMMCKVTAIDAETGYAICMRALKKTWPIFNNVSGRMEPEGTRRVLEELKDSGVKVDRVTTDRSTVVMALMRDEFPEIEHKRDAWHMVKGIKKDLLTEAKKKRSKDLIDFVPGIKNHFWYSIAEAKGEGELCREILLSSLFHIIGVHKWAKRNICSQLTDAIKIQVGNDRKRNNAFIQKNPSKCSTFFKTLNFESITHCCHEDIAPENDESDYMDPLSNGYFYLLMKLTAEKFLKDVPLLSPDLTTSSVENFHSVASGIYTPKRTYFPYESYVMRSCLAVLHHNNNERSAKEGNRTILRKVTYPSKALGGQMVTKKVKSKAPIAWKHNIISQCVEVFEKGEGILEDVYATEDADDENLSDDDSHEQAAANVQREQLQEIDEEMEELEDDVTEVYDSEDGSEVSDSEDENV